MPRSLPATPPGGTSPTTALAPVQPWRETAVVLRRRMFTLLIKLDPGLMVRLEGAWERVVRGGPHSSSQAAHSAVELVERRLWSGAPDTDTLAWHTEQHRPADEIANGRPTRPLRMRYILRERDPDGAIASAYVRHAQEVIEHLQRSSTRKPELHLASSRALVMSIENVLIFLFLAELAGQQTKIRSRSYSLTSPARRTFVGYGSRPLYPCSAVSSVRRPSNQLSGRFHPLSRSSVQVPTECQGKCVPRSHPV